MRRDCKEECAVARSVRPGCQKQLDRKLRRPSKAEERKINRGIKSDPETFEASHEEFAEVKVAREVLPSVVYREAIKRRRGRDVSVGSGKETGNVAA